MSTLQISNSPLKPTNHVFKQGGAHMYITRTIIFYNCVNPEKRLLEGWKREVREMGVQLGKEWLKTPPKWRVLLNSQIAEFPSQFPTAMKLCCYTATY